MNRLNESPEVAKYASERGETARKGNISPASTSDSHESKCAECGASYAKLRKHQSFCSPKCRKAFWVKDRTVHPEHDIRIKLDAILDSLSRIETRLRIRKGEA